MNRKHHRRLGPTLALAALLGSACGPPVPSPRADEPAGDTIDTPAGPEPPPRRRDGAAAGPDAAALRPDDAAHPPEALDAGAAPPDGRAEDARPPEAGPPDELEHLQRVVPVLLVSVGGKTITADSKIDGTLRIITDHDGTLVRLESRPVALETRIGIGIRGNSSAWAYAQKPYGIEIRDARGADLALPLLGLPKESDYVLHSCYADKTCMRNALTYAVAREMAWKQGRWAPRTRYVELFLDGRYEGLYLLVERIKRDKERVALPAPAPDPAQGDVTGGYVFSVEGNADKPPDRYFTTPLTGSLRWVYRSPSWRQITAAQKSHLQRAVTNGLLQRLAAVKRWSEVKSFADTPSWIDYFLLQELTNNTDGYWKSWYFYKQPDSGGGRFFMGPPWDFDVAYGNINHGLRYCATNLRQPPISVFKGLFSDPALLDEMRCRYQELRRPGGPLDVPRLDARLDAFARHMARAKARDQARWGNIGRYVWPNNYVGATWTDEVQYLKYWLRKRLAWLDQKLPGACATGPDPAPVPALAPPPPARESAPRMPLYRDYPPRYVPIEGPVDPALASYACPR